MRGVFFRYVEPLLFLLIAAVTAVGVALLCEQRIMQQSTVAADDYVVGYEQTEYEISPYDNLFRRVAFDEGFDWRLMSAMAKVESRFVPDAKSRVGAVGIMQVMPHVARELGCKTKEELLDVLRNIEVAAMILKDNKRMLRPFSGVSSRDSLSFILACYNAGYPRIADARALARHYGENGREWSVVARYMALLADPEFYEHEVVKRGRFTGSDETISYVNKVLASYDDICRRVAL